MMILKKGSILLKVMKWCAKHKIISGWFTLWLFGIITILLNPKSDNVISGELGAGLGELTILWVLFVWAYALIKKVFWGKPNIFSYEHKEVEK